MNNIALGQYVHKNSIIHKLDARTKILALIILMVSIFLIPSPSKVENIYIPFILMAVYLFFIILAIILTKVSIIKYLNSIKQIIFIIVFAFIVQLFTKSDSGNIYNIEMNFNWINISISVIVLVLFIVLRKLLKCKMLLFFIIVAGIFYLLTFNFGITSKTATLKIYETGLYNGAFYSLRILLVIMLSTILTLTTKPIDISHAIEWMLHPLTFLKINVSIFAMMLSLALRYIPTIFNETNKILKAQSSRGVDFKEGNLKQQINQIVSLLIPIFVIAYKRSEELAFAMEARGYDPGKKRTSITKMSFKFSDLLFSIVILLILSATIYLKVVL